MAWSGAGHQAIGAEAHRRLSPELKAEATDMLKAHPDYVKWAKACHPNPCGRSRFRKLMRISG
jgi:hypothetical protein